MNYTRGKCQRPPMQGAHSDTLLCSSDIGKAPNITQKKIHVSLERLTSQTALNEKILRHGLMLNGLHRRENTAL